MIQQEDSEERRGLARDLVLCSMGIVQLQALRDEFKRHGGQLDVRHVKVKNPPGDRFIIFVTKTGAVYDHFDFIGEEGLNAFCEMHSGGPSVEELGEDERLHS